MLKYKLIKAIEEISLYMNLEVELSKVKKFLIKNKEWYPSQLFFYLFEEMPRNKLKKLYQFAKAVKELVEVDAYLTNSL